MGILCCEVGITPTLINDLTVLQVLHVSTAFAGTYYFCCCRSRRNAATFVTTAIAGIAATCRDCHCQYRRHSGHYRRGRYSSYPTPNSTPTNTTLLFYEDGMYYYYGDTRNTRMEEERQRMNKAMLAAQRSGRTEKDDGLPKCCPEREPISSAP